MDGTWLLSTRNPLSILTPWLDPKPRIFLEDQGFSHSMYHHCKLPGNGRFQDILPCPGSGWGCVSSPHLTFVWMVQTKDIAVLNLWKMVQTPPSVVQSVPYLISYMLLNNHQLFFCQYQVHLDLTQQLMAESIDIPLLILFSAFPIPWAF